VEEKRVHPRVRIEFDVTCEIADGPGLQGVAKDISLGGVFIASAQTPPPFGTKLTVVARLPGASSESRLPGVVRWNKPDGFGVQFGLLGARDTHSIANLLKG